MAEIKDILDPAPKKKRRSPAKLHVTNKKKLINYPDTLISPEVQRKTRRLYAGGMSQGTIAKTVSISRPTVSNIIHAPGAAEEIEKIKNRLIDKSAALAELALDSIAPSEVTKASLMQKATIYGIMTDKVVDLTAQQQGAVDDTSLLSGLNRSGLVDYLKDGKQLRVGIVIDTVDKSQSNTTGSGQPDIPPKDSSIKLT